MTAISYLFTVKSYLSEGLSAQFKFTVNQKDLSHNLIIKITLYISKC